MLESNSDLEAHLVAGSHSNDWLGHMILAVRTVSSGADFIPLPYVRAAFSTVLILLETVEKVKKNRDDLRDLCASTVEIVIILRYKSSMIGVELATLCEEFVAYLSVLRTGLEHLIKGRRGIGGRIKELLGAGNIASQIERYKTRVNELRSNFILLTTLDTHQKVATISSGVAQLPAPPSLQTAFRRIALGDINLLYEAPMSSRVYQIKIYVARISGESSLKTVVKYENLHDEKWKQDLEVYSRFRHPHVWQLFGVSTAPGLQALIYHDELIPLAIYRRFHRPASNLVWVCVEAMLFKQFEDCSHHHHWLDGNREEGLGPTICVKRDPPRICLTMAGLEDEEDEDLDTYLAAWHTEEFGCENNSAEIKTIHSIVTAHSHPTLSKVLSQSLDWGNFFGTLVPERVWAPTVDERRERVSLGSIVTQFCQDGDSFYPVGYIPPPPAVQFQPWHLNETLDVHGHQEGNRFTFSPGTFNTTQISRSRLFLRASIRLTQKSRETLNASWLSQANKCIGPTRVQGAIRYRYGVVNELSFAIEIDGDFKHLLRREGISQEIYLFVCPVSIRTAGSYIGLDAAQWDLVHWSIEPTKHSPLSQDKADAMGLPRLKFHFLPTANFWYEYHYSALREFSEAKAMDPYSDGLPRLLGFPIAQMEAEVPQDIRQSPRRYP